MWCFGKAKHNGKDLFPIALHCARPASPSHSKRATAAEGPRDRGRGRGPGGSYSRAWTPRRSFSCFGTVAAVVLSSWRHCCRPPPQKERETAREAATASQRCWLLLATAGGLSQPRGGLAPPPRPDSSARPRRRFWQTPVRAPTAAADGHQCTAVASRPRSDSNQNSNSFFATAGGLVR